MQSSLKFFCRTGSLLLAAFTLLSCLGPIMFMLGPVALPCELMTHFRLQFTLVLIVMTGALFALKLRNYGIISLVALVMNAVPIILLYAPQNASANPEASAGARAQSGAEVQASPTKESSPIKVRLISSNVNNRNKSYKEVLEVLSSKDADIICINELAPKMSEFLKENLKSYPYNCLGAREDCFGIGVFSRYPLVAPKVVTLSGSGVPTVVTDVDVNGKHFRLISTHPTPPVSVQWFNWRNQQFSELAKLSRGSDIPVVVAGDLNSTCWSPYFERLLQDGSLYDSEKGFGLQPSWPTALLPTFTVFKIPIDHILAQGAFRIGKREILADLGSDHYPLFVEIECRNLPSLVHDTVGGAAPEIPARAGRAP